MRITQHPYITFSRSRKVEFIFEGRRVEGYEGETVGATLHALGQRVLARSFKYHRPRGLFCVRGRCPNCLMRIDGIPNTRACQQKVRPGMTVESQHAWPSARTDLYSIMDRLDFLFPIGFQYRRFIRPRILWPFIEKVIRHASGLGELPSPGPMINHQSFRREEKKTDVLVIGGGAAGISAALAAREAGVNVTLVDDDDRLGGMLKFQTEKLGEPEEFSGMRGFEVADLLKKSVEDYEIEVITGATAFGLYEGNEVGVEQGGTYYRISAKSVVVATGAYEKPIIFSNCDLPGVFPSTGAQILMHRFGVKPGKESIVATTNDYGLLVANQLLDAGVAVKAVVDSRTLQKPNELHEQLQRQGVPIHQPAIIIAAHGRKEVAAATIEFSGRKARVGCDTICTSGGFVPANDLILQAGGSVILDNAGGIHTIHDKNMMVLPGIFVAGDASETGSLSKAILEGKIAGISAAEVTQRLAEKVQQERARYLAALERVRGGSGSIG